MKTLEIKTCLKNISKVITLLFCVISLNINSIEGPGFSLYTPAKFGLSALSGETRKNYIRRTKADTVLVESAELFIRQKSYSIAKQSLQAVIGRKAYATDLTREAYRLLAVIAMKEYEIYGNKDFLHVAYANLKQAVKYGASADTLRMIKEMFNSSSELRKIHQDTLLRDGNSRSFFILLF